MNTKKLFDLSGRVAIVTGGSTGLGLQMAIGLAEMGANLVLCARKIERCEKAAAELEKLGAKTIALACDVKNPANVQAVVDAAVAKFGRIDILINNAGTSWGAPVEEMKLEHWNKVIETNLTGTFLFAQAAGKVMVPARRGKIINISSVAGIHGAPPQFQAIVRLIDEPILQPIYDLQSPQLAFGRVAIVGDAAFVARPHVAAGVSKAADDAAALAQALDDSDVASGLRRFEAERLPQGRKIIERARHLGAYLQATQSAEERARSARHSIPEAVLAETAVLDFLYA